jgi:hypothetical protein
MGPDLKRERIREVMESIQDFPLGIDATATFAANKHQGLDRVYYTGASAGRFVPLKEEDWRKWAQ